MKHRLASILPLAAVFLVAILALGATLSVALLAHEGQTRVALFATSGSWAQVEASGVPVVRLALGGLLIVVDGAGTPGGLARLRAGSVFLMDAALIPGCEPPVSASAPGVDS